MKRTGVTRNLFISVVALLTVLFALPASAKTALDKYAGKTLKTTTKDTIEITCDKGAVINPDSIKATEKVIHVSVYTLPDDNTPALAILPQKPGTGTVSIKYEYKGKTTTYKLKVKVTKYVCPVKTITFGKFKYHSSKDPVLARLGYVMQVLDDGETKK